MFRFCLTSYFEAFSSEILSECGCERFDMSEIALITEICIINRVRCAILSCFFVVLSLHYLRPIYAGIFSIALWLGSTYVGPQMSTKTSLSTRDLYYKYNYQNDEAVSFCAIYQILLPESSFFGVICNPDQVFFSICHQNYKAQYYQLDGMKISK